MTESLGVDDDLIIRLKGLDVSNPTKAKVTFSLNAVSDGVEREVADLVVDETSGAGKAPNANLIINSAKIALALRVRTALDSLRAELPSDVRSRV